MATATDATRHVRDLDPHPLLEAEDARAVRFFEQLDDAGWDVPTDCPGWRRREMLAHRLTGEEYNRSTLDGTRESLVAEGAAAGAHDLDSFNAWGVSRHAARPAAELLDEFRRVSATNHRALHDLGDGDVDSMVGPYPARLQAFHLAFESAIHNDDMQVPVDSAERESRDAWRAAVARFVLEEYGHPVELERVDGGTRVRARATGDEAVVGDADLVRGASGRLRERAAEYPAAIVEALGHPG